MTSEIKRQTGYYSAGMRGQNNDVSRSEGDPAHAELFLGDVDVSDDGDGHGEDLVDGVHGEGQQQVEDGEPQPEL